MKNRVVKVHIILSDLILRAIPYKVRHISKLVSKLIAGFPFIRP